MAEVGLLPFARIALQVCRAVLPQYRSRFSKHQFTQPQLLAILCLMRYEDWTFREAEVRLREHSELRAPGHSGSRIPPSDVSRFSAGVVWAARQNRNRFLGDQTQALDQSTGSPLAHADAASSVARTGV